MRFILSGGKLRGGAVAALMWAGVATGLALDSKDAGLEPVYPQLHPERTQVLGAEALAAALAKLPGWQEREGILYKVYVTPNYREATALMVKISYPIDRLDHHPEIRNIYGKVYVGFTTYDQGKKVTTLDVEAALAVEAAVAGGAAKAGH